MEEYLKQLNQDIKDIFIFDIQTTKAQVVPSRNDENLTFPVSANKKGKFIETCVLFIDIRNSTKISRRLKSDKVKLGKVYSAFVYAMTDIADKYGYVRNIVGDRVMVVFEPNSCYVDAINCAALMYTVARRIIKVHSGLEEFNIGIGIDFGEMLVLKTGIQKRYQEQSEHKGLVWVGDTANTASKLCDFANKEYSSPIFKVTYEHEVYEDVFKGFAPTEAETTLQTLINRINPTPIYKKEFVTKQSSMRLSANDFAKDVKMESSGWKYNGYKVLSLDIENRTGITSSILLSGKVFNEFKNLVPKSPFLSNLTKKDYPDSPYTGSGIYGGSFIVPEIRNIKI